MEALWQVLLRATQEDEALSCQDCFVLMDTLSDLLAAGQAPRAVLPIAEKYLARCPNCMEDYRQDMAEYLMVPLEKNEREPAQEPRRQRQPV